MSKDASNGTPHADEHGPDPTEAAPGDAAAADAGAPAPSTPISPTTLEAARAVHRHYAERLSARRASERPDHG